MSLCLSKSQRDRLQEHAERSYPEECAGLVLGRRDPTGTSIVEALPLANVSTHSRHNRFQLDPLDCLNAEKRAAATGLEVLGSYHSHPDHPALPSAFDLEHASAADWSYLIVPVASGRAGPPRSWVLSPDRSQFLEESLELQAGTDVR